MAAPRVTIDELPEQTSAVGTDLLVVQNGTITKKLMVDKLTTSANAALTAHISDPSAAHVAAAIGATPNTAPLSGTDVQTQLAQAAAAIDALGGGTTLTAENVRDIVAAFIQAGANVTVVHDDPGDILTIASTAAGGGGITTEDAVDAVAGALVAGAGISIAYNDAANTITIIATGGGGVTDGDKGAITVSGGGTIWTLDDDVVTNPKIADSPPLTIKGNNTGAVAQIADLTAAQTKVMLGLDNVNNTGDLGKPVSIAQQDALNLKVDKTTTISTTGPMTGGGDLSASRTIDILPFSATVRGAVPPPTTADTVRYLRADGTWATPAGGGGGVTDGDKGDIVVSSSGATWTIDSAVVANSKLATMATGTFKGNNTGSTGAPVDMTTLQAKVLLGIDNVNNTGDSAKPVSTAQQAALDTKAPIRRTVKADTTTAYTPIITDENQMVTLSNAAAITVTMPQNSAVAFPIGTEIDFLWFGAGQPTFVAGSGATCNGTPGLKLRAQFSAATAKKVSTNGWVIIGDLAA